MKKKLQAVILAGGRGTRLGKLGKKIPKAMVSINDKPFIDLIIEQLKKEGIKKFLILTGYKKEIIQDYFKNNKDVKIQKGRTNWKILTRLLKAKRLIKKKFLLMYCDNFLPKFSLTRQINLMNKKKSNIIFSIIEKKKKQKGTILERPQKKIYYKKDIKSSLAEAGYILINKRFFFKNINPIIIKKDLPDYFHFLSKKYYLCGINYKKNFLCVESELLLTQSRNYFKIKHEK